MSKNRTGAPGFRPKDVSPYRHCQWPFGEPGTKDFHFCGKGTVDGFSYCAKHVEMAYRQPEPRRTAPTPAPGRRAA